VGTTKGQIMQWFIGVVAFAIFFIMASTDALVSWTDQDR
jgi:hypothetical protein